MKKLILLGIAVFILALILKTPASLITQSLESSGNIALRGVTGSLWKGKAAQLSVADQVLGELSWTVSPWRLLTGRVQGELAIQGSELSLDGQYAVSFARVLSLDNTRFDASAELINHFQNYARLSMGLVKGQIDHLEMPLSFQTPPLLAATINLEEAGLASPVSLAKGNYQLKIEPKEKGVLLGKLQSQDAPVEIKGTVTLNQDWRYQTNLKIKATPRGKNLQATLSMIGRARADGYIPVKESGQLKF